MRRNGIMLATLVLLLLPSNLSAQTPQPKRDPTLRSLIRTGSNTIYFDLFRMVLPDLEFDPKDRDYGIAHRTIPIRHIGDTETESLEGNFWVTSFGKRSITSDGRQVIILQLDLSAEGANQGTPYEGEAALLAAFSTDATPKLLDVMDVKTDRFTDFWDAQPVFQLNSQHGAVVIHNTHFNSGESYDDLQVLFLDGERFKVITGIFLLNTQGCGATVTETPSFRALPDPRKYPKLIVKVTVKKEADSQECSRKSPAYTKYYEGVFYWNPAKGEYQGNSRQLNALDKFNRNRL